MEKMNDMETIRDSLIQTGIYDQVLIGCEEYIEIFREYIRALKDLKASLNPDQLKLFLACEELSTKRETVVESLLINYISSKK